MLRSRILRRLLASHVLVVLVVLSVSGALLFGDSPGDALLALGVAGLAGLIASAVAAVWSAWRWCGPVSRLTDAARAWTRSPVNRPLPIHSRDEIGTLTAAFNDMGQSIAEAIARMHQELEQLRAVFRSMAEGVVVIDGEQRILFLNEAGSRMLNVPLEGSEGKRLWEIVRHRQLLEAVEVVFREGPQRCELDWPGPEPKVFSLHGTRLPGESLQGAVLVLHDITHVRRLERVRQDFVANVSHELKTPLAAIKATVETLLDGAIEDPEHNVRFLQRVHENAERLHFLVQDLLTLSRIESGEERIEAVPLAVAGVIESCVSRQIDRAKAKQLKLKQEPPPEPILANADEEALAQILDNLVDNAIKYTPSGGTITLRWYAQDGWAVIEVADTGVGIPEKDLGRIFERFYRVDKARSRELGGTGLGLSIVKHLVQALGGSVQAASQLGVGSTFTVRLPLAESSSLVVAV